MRNRQAATRDRRRGSRHRLDGADVREVRGVVWGAGEVPGGGGMETEAEGVGVSEVRAGATVANGVR